MGKCAEFPIFIINTPPQEIEAVEPLNKDFKIHGLPKEFEEGVERETNTEVKFNYTRNAWSTVAEPK